MRKMLPTLLAALVVLPVLLTPRVAPAEDLIQIYDLAVQSDPKLRESEQTLFATKEKRPQAMALLLPNVSVQGTGDFNKYENRAAVSPTTGVTAGFAQSLGMTPGILPDKSQTYLSQNGRATLKQPVYNRGYWMSLKQTDSIIAAAEAQYRSAQIDLMVRTTEKYLAVLQAADQVMVGESQVRSFERQLEQSKQRFEVGLVAITDVNDNQAQYDISVANLIGYKKALDDAWEALRVIVGPIKMPPLARLGEKLPLAPPKPNNVTAWSDSAQRHNYTIVAAAENAASAKTNIEVQQSGHYPQLDLHASYDINRSGYIYGNDANTGIVGLTLTVPLYQGGAVVSRTREAGYQFRAAQDKLDQARRDVDQQVKDSFRGVLSSIEDVKARQTAVASTLASVASTEAGLEVGTRTQVEVLIAQQKYFQAEYEYLASRYKYILNGLKLHQATSTLTRDILARGNAWLNSNDKVMPPTY